MAAGLGPVIGAFLRMRAVLPVAPLQPAKGSDS